MWPLLRTGVLPSREPRSKAEGRQVSLAPGHPLGWARLLGQLSGTRAEALPSFLGCRLPAPLGPGSEHLGALVRAVHWPGSQDALGRAPPSVGTHGPGTHPAQRWGPAGDARPDKGSVSAQQWPGV